MKLKISVESVTEDFILFCVSPGTARVFFSFICSFSIPLFDFGSRKTKTSDWGEASRRNLLLSSSKMLAVKNMILFVLPWRFN